MRVSLVIAHEILCVWKCSFLLIYLDYKSVIPSRFVFFSIHSFPFQRSHYFPYWNSMQIFSLWFVWKNNFRWLSFPGGERMFSLPHSEAFQNLQCFCDHCQETVDLLLFYSNRKYPWLCYIFYSQSVQLWSDVSPTQVKEGDLCL